MRRAQAPALTTVLVMLFVRENCIHQERRQGFVQVCVVQSDGLFAGQRIYNSGDFVGLRSVVDVVGLNQDLTEQRVVHGRVPLP